MAPVVESVGSYQSSAASNSHDLNLPSGVTAGDLLLAFVSCDGRRTFTMTGWTTLFSDTDNVGGSGTGGNSLHIAYREATGTDPVTVGISSNENVNGLIYRVSGHEDPGTQAPEVVTNVQSGNTPDTTSDPPSLSPTGGSKDYLWFTGVGVDNEDITTPPTNYDTNDTILNTVGTGEAPLGVSWRTNTAASEDPSAWGTWASDTHIGFTLAVHPAAGGAATLERSASFDAAVAVASAQERDLVRSAAIDASVSVASAQERDLVRSAAIDAAVSVETNRVREVVRSAAIDAAVALASAQERDLVRSAALDAAVAIASAQERDLVRSAVIDGAVLIAVAPQRDLIRSAAIDAAVSVVSAQERDLIRSAAIDAAVSIASDAEFFGLVLAAASFNASVDISSAQERDLVRAASFNAAVDIATSQVREILRSVGIDGAVDISVNAISGTLHLRSASFDAAVDIASDPQRDLVRSAAIDAGVSVTAAQVRELLRSAGLDAAVDIGSDGEIVVVVNLDRNVDIAWAEMVLQPGDGHDGWIVRQGDMGLPGTGRNPKRRRTRGLDGRI